MDTPVGSAAASIEFHNHALALAEATELRDGPDGKPFLFNIDTGTVLALHGPGPQIVSLIDGSRSLVDLYEMFDLSSQDADEPRRHALTAFVRGLEDADMLRWDENEDVRSRSVEAQHLPNEMPPGWKVRFHLERPPRTTEPILEKGRSRRALTLLTFFLAGAIGHVLVILALRSSSASLSVLSDSSNSLIGFILALILLQVALHEVAHALLLRQFGLSTREIGLRFWFYIFPLPYVAQSAEVFLPRRRQRAGVAAAGVAADGLTGAILLTALDAVFDPTTVVAWAAFHVTILVVNLNPFLPTDGARFVEAVLGEVSLRQRSVRWAVAVARRRPLPPGSPTTLGRKMYGVVSLVVVFGVGAWICLRVIQGVSGGFG